MTWTFGSTRGVVACLLPCCPICRFDGVSCWFSSGAVGAGATGRPGKQPQRPPIAAANRSVCEQALCKHHSCNMQDSVVVLRTCTLTLFLYHVHGAFASRFATLVVITWQHHPNGRPSTGPKPSLPLCPKLCPKLCPSSSCRGPMHACGKTRVKAAWPKWDSGAA